MTSAGEGKKKDIVRMSKSALLRVMQDGKHPARLIAFDELVSGLEKEVKEKLVARKISKQKELADLQLFNYTDRATYTRGWNQYSLLARGLVVDTKRKLVVATPFPKFFNLGEVSVEEVVDGAKAKNSDKSDKADSKADAKSAAGRFVTSEKMDGSLGIIFQHNDNWFVITRGLLRSPLRCSQQPLSGSFDSEQSQVLEAPRSLIE